MADGVRVDIDPVRFFRATNGPGGVTRQFMNRVRIQTADHLQRNAPRNSPQNERHRERGSPNYALGFKTEMYGNQSGTGFRLSNTVNHAAVVEFGRSGSTKNQVFSWKKWGGEIRRSPTKARPGTRYMQRTAERVVRRAAAG